MTALALIFTLSAIGISITTYLIRSRRAQVAPACFVGGACHQVLESKYNKTLGVHNDILGLAYYMSVAILAGMLVLEIKPLQMYTSLFFTLELVGALVSVYFTYLQAKVIKVWCFWCLASAATTWAMAAIAIIGIMTKG